MYLRLSSLSPLSFHSKKPPSPSSSKALSLLFQTFEETLLRHLKSLIPSPDVGSRTFISFSYLSRAVDILSSTHAVADALISDPSLSGSREAALSSYIDSSIKLLDACNAILAEIKRLQRGRLLLLFVVHILSSSEYAPPPEKIRKARESIREWEESSRRGISAAAADLTRDLALRDAPPRRKLSAVGRTIYALEAVSALVAGSVVALLGGKVDFSAEVRVPGGFAWGGAFNELREAVSGDICRRSPVETETVETCVRRLAEVIDDAAADGEKTERLRSAVKELEKATEESTEGLDRLGSAVDGLFRAVLRTRNSVVLGFLGGPLKCK